MAATVNIEINLPFDKAYEYLQDPLNLVDWAVFFEEITQNENGLTARTPLGLCDLAFVAPNEYGVLDYVVRDAAGEEHYHPMRAIHAGNQTLMALTVLNEEESGSTETAKADLKKLKEILEK